MNTRRLSRGATIAPSDLQLFLLRFRLVGSVSTSLSGIFFIMLRSYCWTWWVSFSRWKHFSGPYVFIVPCSCSRLSLDGLVRNVEVPGRSRSNVLNVTRTTQQNWVGLNIEISDSSTGPVSLQISQPFKSLAKKEDSGVQMGATLS